MVIIIEGEDGTGKSTVVAELYDALQEKSPIDLHIVREPGGVNSAELIRDAIFNIGSPANAKKFKALLFYASRDITLQELVIPILKSGGSVIYDRFSLSSMVYQGELLGHMPFIEQLEEHIVGDAFTGLGIPVYKFVLKVSHEELERRLTGRGVVNSYDPKSMDEAVLRHSTYLRVAEQQGYTIIENSDGSATKTIMEILGEVV